MTVQVNRNPFSRIATMRTTLPPRLRTNCLNCSALSAKFRYHFQTDAGRRIDDTTPLSVIHKSGPFCSIHCFREYNQ